MYTSISVPNESNKYETFIQIHAYFLFSINNKMFVTLKKHIKNNISEFIKIKLFSKLKQ